MKNPPPDFDLGDHVTITPMEDCPGRVIAMELDRDGWTIVARYFQNGEAKTLKAFPDEIVRVPRLLADGDTFNMGPGRVTFVREQLNGKWTDE